MYKSKREIKPTILNQGQTGACTMFALIGAINSISDKNLNALDERNKVLKTSASAGSRWIQAGMNFAKKRGWIRTTKELKEVEHAISYLDYGCPLLTMSGKIDFNTTGKTKDFIAVFGDGTRRHARYICGYDKEKKLFKCVNSRGDTRGDKGYFYLKFEDFTKVGSKYAIYV